MQRRRRFTTGAFLFAHELTSSNSSSPQSVVNGSSSRENIWHYNRAGRISSVLFDAVASAWPSKALYGPPMDTRALSQRRRLNAGFETFSRPSRWDMI